MTSFAMVFPGQGSQSVGMLAQLGAKEPIIQETFAQASTVLDYDLWDRVQNGSSEQLNQTQITQPALLCASVALFRVWQSRYAELPAVMAGHSLGEYSALVCAGALEFTGAIKLVEQRGRVMQEAVPQGVGAMAAVLGLENAVVEDVCCSVATPACFVGPVNYNAPGQIVIAGHAQAVEQVQPLLKEKGAKRVLPLPVSVPSHCCLMTPAANKFAEILKTIKVDRPKIPVINNVDAKSVDQAPEILDALVRQLNNPVQWTHAVRKMADMGITYQLEMGPGNVLTGLVKRIDKRIKGVAVNADTAYQTAVEQIREDERLKDV